MSAREAPTVWVCRGCCCGTVKHPDTDHDGQLAALRTAIATVHGARLVVTDCVDECERSNVIVIRDRQHGRRKDVWLGHVLDVDQTETLADWLRQTDRDHLPAKLDRLRFSPKHSSRLPRSANKRR